MNIIAHVEIPVENLKRATRFYASLLGVAFGEPVDLHGSRMAFFPFEEGTDGASGALCEGTVYRPSRDGAIVYFTVTNIDVALATATVLGSEILFPKTGLDSGAFVAEITDSEGNRIALQTLSPIA
jgi:predicted enzyme related to lactoylglutathione lyase